MIKLDLPVYEGINSLADASTAQRLAYSFIILCAFWAFLFLKKYKCPWCTKYFRRPPLPSLNSGAYLYCKEKYAQEINFPNLLKYATLMMIVLWILSPHLVPGGGGLLEFFS